MNEGQVLIVGAGPTGLALALFLQKAGVTPRLIDRNSGPGQASRGDGRAVPDFGVLSPARVRQRGRGAGHSHHSH